MTIRLKLLLAFIPILISLIVVVLIGSTSLMSLHDTMAGLYQNQLLPSKQFGYTHLHLVKLEDSLNNLVSAQSPDEMKVTEGQVRVEIGQVQTYLDKIDRKSLSASEQALLLQFADHWTTLVPEADQVASHMKRGDNLGAQKALDTAKIQLSILDSLLTGLSEANELQGSKAFDQSEQFRRGLIILIGSIVLAALAVSLYIIYLIRDTAERQHLDQSIRMYRMLSDCNEALSQCSNDQTLLAQICTIIQNIGQYPQVWVGYIEYDEASTMKPAFVLGFNMDVFDQMMNSWGNNNSGGGLTGQAARSGKPVMMHDISKIAPPYWRKGVDQYKLGSGIALPLKNGDHVFGTLSIYSQDPKGFNPPEVDLLTRLADNLALGLIMLESRENQHKMEQALRESEYKLRAVYDHHYQFTGLLDATGQTISVNQAALNLVRTDLQAIQGKPFWECPWWTHSPELQEMLKQGIQQVQTGVSVRFDATHRDWRGNLHDVDFSITPIFDDNSKVIMIVPEGNDITDRKHDERLIKSQINQLTLLQEVDRAIIKNSGLKATVQAVIKPIARYFGADAIEILVLDESRRKLLHTAQHGFQRPEHLKPFLIIGEGIAGQAALENRIVEIENDISALACPNDKTFYQREGFVSCYALPLTTSTIENAVQGVLQFFYRKPIIADKDWLDYLRAVGDQVAIAVEKALLFERLQQTLESLVKAYETTLEGWVYALDLRDQETENHTLRVVDLTLQIAREMGVPEDQLLAIRRGALLHDIGKLGIPDAILHKPAALDEDEIKVMRTHPALAFEMLRPIEYLRGSLDIPFCHHEKWDGTGYPRGLKGDNIPLSARIFAVVDVWDALTSDRVYRKALPKEEALQIILRQAGKQFDPKVVGHFLNIIQNMSRTAK